MILIASFFLLVSHVADNYAADDKYGKIWDYKVNGANGPEHWRRNASICGHNAQSPINILTDHVTYNADLSIKLDDYDQIGGNTTFAMTNRNTDIAFEGKVKNGGNTSQTITFKGVKYRFYQFHFHWGAENQRGSEHLVDWQPSAGELHIIHQNTKYRDISEAVDKNDGLLVWGHFLRVNSRDQVDNPDFQTLLNKFSSATRCCAKTDVNVNLFKLLPKSHEHFFTYQGGLTTPPCYESVRWVVNRHPILISERQMNTFRSLKDEAMGGVELSDNFRPPQPLNGRIVESNFNPNDMYTVRGTGTSIAPCFFIILSIVCSLLFTF